MNTGPQIRELTLDAEIGAAFALMAELRPHLRAEEFVQQVSAQARDGYRLFGGFAQDRLVTLAGIRFARTLSRGPHLFVDDLVTASGEQGKGFGTAMLRFLAGLAEERGLTSMWLDGRNTALTFYERVGFGVHTSKPCWIETWKLRENPGDGSSADAKGANPT